MRARGEHAKHQSGCHWRERESRESKLAYEYYSERQPTPWGIQQLADGAEGAGAQARSICLCCLLVGQTASTAVVFVQQTAATAAAACGGVVATVFFFFLKCGVRRVFLGRCSVSAHALSLFVLYLFPAVSGQNVSRQLLLLLLLLLLERLLEKNLFPVVVYIYIHKHTAALLCLRRPAVWSEIEYRRPRGGVAPFWGVAPPDGKQQTTSSLPQASVPFLHFPQSTHGGTGRTVWCALLPGTVRQSALLRSTYCCASCAGFK